MATKTKPQPVKCTRCESRVHFVTQLNLTEQWCEPCWSRQSGGRIPKDAVCWVCESPHQPDTRRLTATVDPTKFLCKTCDDAIKRNQIVPRNRMRFIGKSRSGEIIVNTFYCHLSKENPALRRWMKQHPHRNP